MVKIQRIKCGNVNCYIIGENGNAVLVDTARTKYREPRPFHKIYHNILNAG